MKFELKENGKDAVFTPESEQERNMAKLLTDLCTACIAHGGDYGGPYCANPEPVIEKAEELARVIGEASDPRRFGFASELEIIEESMTLSAKEAEEYEHSFDKNASVKRELLNRIFYSRARPFVRFRVFNRSDEGAEVSATMIAFRALDEER